MSSHKKIVWSADNPGGANAVIPVVEELLRRGDEVVGVLSGPALTMAQEKKLPLASEPPWHPGVLLAGTSVGDSIDKRLLRELGIPSVYVLDFWNNYRARFADVLPTRLCVMDDAAREEAVADGIPAECVVVTGNPYFEHFADGILPGREEKNLIVFVSQPIRGDATGYDFDEYQALADVAAALPPSCHLVIKLHPRDDKRKYNTYLNSRISLADGALEEVLSRAGLVVGMFSPVLMQVAVAGKAVLSYQPGESRDPLPTNRLGLTRKISTKEELWQALADYASGIVTSAQISVETLWPKGAAERIIKVIDSLV